VVDVYINYLRRKVDDGFGKRLIHTIRGVGYELSSRAGAGELGRFSRNREESQAVRKTRNWSPTYFTL